MEAKQKEFRSEPRLTINQLARLMHVPPSEQKTILRKAMEKSPAHGAWRYKDAQRALVPFFLDTSRTAATLTDAATLLRLQKSDSALSDQRKMYLEDSALALDSFSLSAVALRPRGMVAVPGARSGGEVRIEGVQIAVNPDICFNAKGSDERTGGIKLYFSRKSRLTSDMLEAGASILGLYFRERGAQVRPAHCLMIDVFARVSRPMPRANVKLLANVRVMCEAISVWWPSLYRMEIERAHQG